MIVKPCPQETEYLLVDPVVDPSDKTTFEEAQQQICAGMQNAIACAVAEGAPYGHLIEHYGALCKDCTIESPTDPGDPIDPDAIVPCLTCD